MRLFTATLLVLFAGAASTAQPATPTTAQSATVPSVSGEVLEARDADPYTYLRLKTKKGELWAAVLKTPVKTGTQVTIENPALIKDFESKTLNRKFDQIVFGTLAGTSAAAAPATATAPTASPHTGAPKVDDKPVEKVAKATGPDARTVAEVYAQKAQLKGKTVAVRGKVVKFASNIMGKNWVHLRDGSGAAANGTNDLVATTKDTVRAGALVTARGVVNTDVDIGMGVKYQVLLENTTLKPE